VSEPHARRWRALLSDTERFADAPIEFHERLASTSTRLAKLSAEGAPTGTLVVAREQSKGRGRLGRSYSSPVGGLWFSVLLRERAEPALAPTSLLAGLAVSQAVDEVARVATELKWPNDVLLSGGKLAGILVEAGEDRHGPRVLVGVGVNVNIALRAFPLVLRARATSLLLQTGREHDIGAVLVATLSWLDAHLSARDRGHSELLISQFGDRVGLIGRSVKARVGRAKVTGVAVGLSATGALLIRTSDGLKAITAGEVEEVRGG
jgi:BirA family transcriptional regulator, biotin operon repressor / biotin---[acetyl-CoA-carboxylase] ligase